jgi:hypothetical protein
VLHKINFPETCRPFFEWIVELQRQLITRLCQEPVGDVDEIDEDWLFERVSQHLEVDREWFGRFCNWTHKKQTFLDRAHSISGFSDEIKARLLADFENDQTFEDLFDPDVHDTHNLAGLTPLNALDPLAPEIIHHFFEGFYSTAFYPSYGYKISINGHLTTFNRTEFVQEFSDANPDVCVCPMCDGDLGNPKVDHFYPKAIYPYLSCHPMNLVPVCDDCNGPGGKHETPPLSLDAIGFQTDDWFHPYLRSAHSTYAICFQQKGEGTTPVLACEDEQTQTRLDNMSSLLKLNNRWRGALSLKTRIAQRHIKRARKKLGRSLTEAELCDKLTEWGESAEDEIGFESFALIKAAYFQKAAQRDPLLFDELWIYNNPDAEVVPQVADGI